MIVMDMFLDKMEEAIKGFEKAKGLEKMRDEVKEDKEEEVSSEEAFTGGGVMSGLVCKWLHERGLASWKFKETGLCVTRMH
eukprot:3501143-Karenia_brevis.AAC.1